jgi:MSHA biogenesis protein MshM
VLHPDSEHQGELVEHLHHFGLKQDPFQNEPDLRFYFDSLSHIEPYRRVERGLRQNKGLCVMTGECGTGKSLLSRRLLETLEEEMFDAQFMLMMPGATDAKSVLSRYARMLGIEDSSLDRPALLAKIYEQHAIVREEGRHSVLIIDDAHLLSKEALAEIGGLLNLEYEDRRLVSLFLVGLPQLDVTLSHEASLGQRVDVRVLLGPLDKKDTTDYLMHRLSLAGGSPETIPAEAVCALYKFGRGRPRLLNTLADNALFEAYLANRTQLTPEDVERAAADLGVGAQPGQTYAGILAPPRPENPSQRLMDVNDVSAMEFDPMADSGIQALSFVTGGASVSAVDLGELAVPCAEPFEEGGTSGSVVDLAELVTPDADSIPELSADRLMMEGTDDLDSAVQEMLNENSSSSELPVFEGQNVFTPDGAEATRTALPNELTAEPIVEGEGESEDDLDDLFVELIGE